MDECISLGSVRLSNLGVVMPAQLWTSRDCKILSFVVSVVSVCDSFVMSNVPNGSSPPVLESVTDDWNSNDMKIAVAVMVKARLHGLQEQVLQTVDAEYLRITSATTHSMNDSSKRLRDDPVAGPHASIRTYAASASGGVSPPMPSSGQLPMAPSQPSLPEGVNTMEDWGRCYVTFGKLKNKSSYKEVLKDCGEEMMGYKKYLWSHRHSGSPGLVDLVNYLIANECDFQENSVTIPGTKIVRNFK